MKEDQKGKVREEEVGAGIWSGPNTKEIVGKTTGYLAKSRTFDCGAQKGI